MSFDIGLENDDLPIEPQLITGTNFVVQQLDETVSLFFGEWFGDRRVGIDWPGILQEKDPDRRAVLALVESRVAAIEGVVRTENGSVDLQSELLQLSMDVVLDNEATVTFAVEQTLNRASNGMPFAVFFRSGRIDGSARR